MADDLIYSPTESEVMMNENNDVFTMEDEPIASVMQDMRKGSKWLSAFLESYRPPLDGERYLTDGEVSELLRVSRRTLQEYRNNRVLPFILLGGKVLYPETGLRELSASGYRVTAKINAPSGVSKVLMPTWTNANGQDDLVWHQASVSGDTATFYVSSSAHKGESGAYTTHIYLYDNAGKLAPLKGVNVTVPSAVVTPPTPSSSLSIGDVSVTELSASGYRVTAKINAPSGVSKVLMPTWTNANGQDDLVWHQASVSGDTATFYVSSSAHKGESGAYTTHIYLYDNAGKLAPLKGVNVTVPSGANPGGNSGNNNGSGTGVLSMAIPYVTELSSNGFRVTIQFNAPAGYKKVSTAVWTAANGQDDLVWHNMTVSGNTATCYVPVSEHKNEHGSYIVNAYVFETDTKYVLQGMTVPVP